MELRGPIFRDWRNEKKGSSKKKSQLDFNRVEIEETRESREDRDRFVFKDVFLSSRTSATRIILRNARNFIPDSLESS